MRKKERSPEERKKNDLADAVRIIHCADCNYHPAGKGAFMGQLRVWPFSFATIAAPVNGAETRAAISQDDLFEQR